MRFLLTSLAASALLLAGCSNASSPAPDEPDTASEEAPDKETDPIALAMSAAPESVSKDATILSVDSKGAVKTLRKGTSDWTCFPDIPDTPTTPGPDPVCVDEGGMTWFTALMEKKDPPKNTIGLGYMLLGGPDASNTDPFATAPPAGEKWGFTGPHIMVFNTDTDFAGYPTTHDDPTAPYVMFPDTPYAHLMVPVE